MWLSDDDRLDRQYVERCAASLVADSESVLAVGSIRYFHDDGELEIVETVPPGMASADPADRIVAYLKAVGLNGQYYGVMRRAAAVSAFYPKVLGGDWMFVAQLVALGKAIPVAGATLDRRLDGASSDMQSLAQAYGLRRRWGRDAYLWVIPMFVRHVVRGTGSFAVMSHGGRLRAAVGLSGVMVSRWWWFTGREQLGIHLLGRIRVRARRLLRRGASSRS